VTMAAARGVPPAATVHLPYTSSSVRAARRRLAADLSQRGVPHAVVDDAVLVLSEILSNALMHARPLDSGKIRVRWDVRGGSLEVEVTDGGGPTRPHPATPSLSSLGGRGLGIVTSLVSDWGVRQVPGETTVWARLPLNGWQSAAARVDRRPV
jgi:anti-sigma regulatory factor (Ser/Thr protein kinase)